MSSTKAAPRYRTSSSSSSSTSSLSKLNDSAITATKATKTQHNFTSMVKKFMEKKSTSKPITGTDYRAMPLIVPVDCLAYDLKKSARKAGNHGSTLTSLPKKLFGKSGSNQKSSSSEKKTLALTEVKPNTRTLAMVLRSERELLSLNKEHEAHIAELNSLLHDRTFEVEKLKDLCLKQREEIKALKSAILFPEEMNSQLHEILEQQGCELKQAKQVIPTLQMQISSLTGQLQNLSQDLAEVKAVKYAGNTSFDGSFSSLTTPAFNGEEPADSQDFCSDDPAMPDSPDNLLLLDANPCLTPCYSKMRSKNSYARDYDYSEDIEDYEVISARARKLSISSDHISSLRSESSATRAPFCRSDESKYRYRKRMEHQVL